MRKIGVKSEYQWTDLIPLVTHLRSRGDETIPRRTNRSNNGKTKIVNLHLFLIEKNAPLEP